MPYTIAPRRAGDLPEFWADASKAEALLGWKAERNLQQMMEDTWRWQSKNPEGYGESKKQGNVEPLVRRIDTNRSPVSTYK